MKSILQCKPYNVSEESLAQGDVELLEIGDQPMDAISSALKKVVRMYTKDLKRKPTPDEMVALLELSIRTLEEDLFNNMDEQELDSVSIVQRKRPKRPRPKPGDFFAIPLPSGGYGYGRIMKVTLRIILWMRLLNVRTDNLSDLTELHDYKTTLDIKTDTRRINSIEWPIIGHLPLSNKDQEALAHEPYWIMGYSADSAAEIADWKLSGKRGLPPNMDAPYVGYRG